MPTSNGVEARKSATRYSFTTLATLFPTGIAAYEQINHLPGAEQPFLLLAFYYVLCPSSVADRSWS